MAPEVKERVVGKLTKDRIPVINAEEKKVILSLKVLISLSATVVLLSPCDRPGISSFSEQFNRKDLMESDVRKKNHCLDGQTV